MNTHVARAAAMAVATAAITGAGWLGTAVAHAEPATIDVSELHNVAAIPQCELEDGSDAAVLPCIWGNEGNAYLTYADRSLLIVDATDGDVSDIDLGA